MSTTIVEALKALYTKLSGNTNAPVTCSEAIDDITTVAGSGGSGEAGFVCTDSKTQLTNETVTTTKPPVEGLDYGYGELSYTSLIDAEAIIVTFDGTEYSCTRLNDTMPYMYGASPGEPSPDWSDYPFGIISTSDGNSIATKAVGTHTIKIEVISSSVITTECFEKAVKKVLDMYPTSPFKYVVNGSYDDNDNVVIDKSFNEIISAYNDGMDVELKLGIDIFRLSQVHTTVLAFAYVAILTGTGVRIQEIRVTKENMVTITTGDITTPIN